MALTEFEQTDFDTLANCLQDLHKHSLTVLARIRANYELMREGKPVAIPSTPTKD